MTYLSKAKGGILVEAIIVLPIFFVILFGILELSYLYRTKATLNTATFQAARVGALNNASLDKMRSELANGMIGLFMEGGTGSPALLTAKLKVKLMEQEISKAYSGSTVTVVSPTKAMVAAFKKDIPFLVDGKKKKFKTIAAVPNDNLTYRSTKTNKVDVGGDKKDINIQDVNLLKIRTFWCHRLVTPGLDQIAYRFVLSAIRSKEQLTCNVVGKINRRVYVAVEASTVVRMQSPVYVSYIK